MSPTEGPLLITALEATWTLNEKLMTSGAHFKMSTGVIHWIIVLEQPSRVQQMSNIIQ
jgi:hypothetical protein